MWRRLIYHPDINYALRQTLVLCLPVAVGLMLGELRFGLLFSLVPACCNIAGLDTPHKRFFKRLIIGASLFATCSLLTQVLLAKDVPLPFLLTGAIARKIASRIAARCHFYPQSGGIHAGLGTVAHLCAGHFVVRIV